MADDFSSDWLKEGNAKNKKTDMRQNLADRIGDLVRLTNVIQRLDKTFPEQTAQYTLLVKQNAELVERVERLEATIKGLITDLESSTPALNDKLDQYYKSNRQTFISLKKEKSVGRINIALIVIALTFTITGLLYRDYKYSNYLNSVQNQLIVIKQSIDKLAQKTSDDPKSDKSTTPKSKR